MNMESAQAEPDVADLDGDNAVTNETEGNNVEQLRSEIQRLKQKEEGLMKDKLATIEQIENDFSSKRARFMMLFKQKEDELESEREVAALLQSECDSYVAQIAKLQHEMDEYKSQIVVMECTRENEMDDEKVKVQQELASLHQVIRDTLAESTRTKKDSEREAKKFKNSIEKLEAEIQELKAQNPSDSKEGVLSVMTKTIAKKVSVLNAYSQSNENIHENLEESMKKPASSGWWAQEDAEVLRSLVVPLEEEIRALKEKLRAADDKIQTYENAYKTFENSSEFSDGKINPELDGKLLEAEKSSRSDLEMYVSVLQGQKATLFCEAEDLRKQLRDVCQLMEKEKREHNELKQTWQMANDQFLEAQKIHAGDLKRMNDILTMEQQRILAGMKRENRDQVTVETVDINSLKRSSPISFLTSPHRRKSPSPARLSGSFMEKSADDKIVEDVLREGENKKSCESISSESDVGFDDNKVQHLVGAEDGKRLPTEKEWLQFQEELKNTKEKLLLPCDMCANYETQLQKSQDLERDLRKAVKALEQSNEWLKNDLETEQQTRKGLEEKLVINSTDLQGQLAELYLKMGEAEKLLIEQKHQFSSSVEDANHRLKELTVNREVVDTELRKLRRENDVLMGKCLANSNRLQNEDINLPNSVDDLQEMHLRLREDLITAVTAKEYIEEVLRSEILVLKERAQGEQQIRESTESMLMQEIDTLRENVGILESMKSTYENEEKRRIEAEHKLNELQKKTSETQAMHKTILHNLQKKVDDGTKEKEKLEADLSEMRMKLYALQRELDSGEAVQRDFVKLSQSLQVQLEGIRKAEEEVRWQHEDDVDECNSCKQIFSVTRRKHHCRHCGRIFCADCTSKVVSSGSNSRPSKVCDVCHTLLVPTTAPYFSTEAPQGHE